MAHSHKMAARSSSKAKFKAITGHKSGGQVHPDEKQDKVLFHKMMAEHEAKSHGSKGHHRVDKRARGGGVKKKGTNVTVNVISPHHHPAVPLPVQVGGAKPPMGLPPGGPPPGGLPPGLPPGAGVGPPGMPPGMPPMKRGGRAYKRGGYIGGESNAGNVAKWAKYAKKNSVEHAARGGRMTAGARSGEGRLQKAKMH